MEKRKEKHLKVFNKKRVPGSTQVNSCKKHNTKLYRIFIRIPDHRYHLCSVTIKKHEERL